MPALIEPQLATLVAHHPSTGDWSYETKFDGYLVMVRIENARVNLITRNGHDWTSRMSRRRQEAIRISDAWLYAEAVVLDPTRKPDFGALQNAFDRRSTADLVQFVFHLPWIDGKDSHGQR